jgi:hypothetical protein
MKLGLKIKGDWETLGNLAHLLPINHVNFTHIFGFHESSLLPRTWTL